MSSEYTSHGKGQGGCYASLKLPALKTKEAFYSLREDRAGFFKTTGRKCVQGPHKRALCHSFQGANTDHLAPPVVPGSHPRYAELLRTKTLWQRCKARPLTGHSHHSVLRCPRSEAGQAGQAA